MQVALKVSNYRCFPSASPLEIELGPGFSAFIGINNAGKSSVLKLFYDLRAMFALFTDDNGLAQLLRGAEVAFQTGPNISDLEGIFSNTSDAADIEIEAAITDPPAGSVHSTSVVKTVIGIPRGSNRCKARVFTQSGAIPVQGPINWNGDVALRAGSNTAVGHFGNLRQMFKDLSNAYYVPSFRHITPFGPVDGAPPSYFDMNVGRPFIDMWHGMQAGTSRSGRERIYHLIEDVRSVFEFRELQITASQNRQTLQLVIDGKSFDLHDLGSGLAQFILVLASAALRKPAFVMIDEPELNLHPSLQVKFLMRLGGYASSGVLFATHNLGLARSVADRIYSITTGANGSKATDLDETPRLAELLGELNYEGYRPLGFGKLLLVEGRTSFKVFVEFLRILNKDHEFLVVPMSDLITQNSKEELQEVTRICPTVFAVIDSEKQDAAAVVDAGRQGFAKNCADLGIRCHITQHRAIENYLSDRAVKAEMGQAYRALNPYEGRQGLQLWHKKDNWKIARRMDRAELHASDLGQFLEAI